ncbi:MAG: proline iminopeptidase [Robiginitomaculum sp.]|nr:MAG: proline iminopeptidase [Robiginitomaculum sp.]
MRFIFLLLMSFTLLSACERAPITSPAAVKDVPVVGEGRMIPITTPKGDFKVWTKKIGDNPDIKVLLLHGGPAMTHEIYEIFGKHFPGAGIEFYYYDQLGSYFSDQPDAPELWQTARFVDEVEQVRQALGLGPDNFYLFGQSWGGILAMEYALAHQDKLKGLIISNMMASIPEYNDYAAKVLMADMDPKVLAELKAFEAAKDYANPRYTELLIEHHYIYHILRMPAETWPDEINRAFSHLNTDIYIPMQGPSELGASGVLGDWDRRADLSNITVPTLIIGATHDTMDPKHMEWMAGQVQNGRFLLCPNGSHLSQYDDEENFFTGLIDFIKDVDNGTF